MLRFRLLPPAVSFGLALGAFVTATGAYAQSPVVGDDVSSSDAVIVGDWFFRPMLELRTRGELRHNPFDSEVRTSSRGTLGTLGGEVPEEDQWLVQSRGRLGLSADHGSLRAVVLLQDARVWGESPPFRADTRDDLPTTGAHVAFGEIRGMGLRAPYLRIGRQEIAWGDGRLLGRSDWSPAGRSLDAARGMLVIGDFDVEGLAAVLTMPGALPPEVSRNATGPTEGTGTQLYGVRGAWHIAPLLQVEWNNLARIVRAPTESLRPSDLFLTGLRVSGDHLAWSYAVEGAYEFGRSALTTATQDIQAYGATGRVEFDTGVLWDLSIGAQGSYATGQETSEGTDETRFDPILPDVRTAHGRMGLYSWSNVMEAAGLLSVTPFDESRFTVAYRYVALAEPTDTWETAALVPIGRDFTNTAKELGQEIDATLTYSPWTPLSIDAGYGVFLTGEGGKNILERSGRGRLKYQHYGFLQLSLKAP